MLCWWPEDGWQRGTVARVCSRGAFSHVVAYTPQTSALRGTADMLLDAASYGVRSPRPLVPGRPAHRLGGSGSPLWPGPPTLTFSLVGGSSQLGPLARPGPEAAVEIVISQNVLRFVLWSF